LTPWTSTRGSLKELQNALFKPCPNRRARLSVLFNHIDRPDDTVEADAPAPSDASAFAHDSPVSKNQ
ncbi:hypothetical protein, partial [Comamonas thiooxydans]|uniref:hypothetical protein n=1 Tax=Comamonas thiooxydans TaxID=363952 RepID=UPI001A943C2D